MELTINPNGIWYHGSNQIFTELRDFDAHGRQP